MNRGHAAGEDSVDAEVVRPSELGREELARWRGFLRARPELGSPFLDPGFASAVDRARDDARVAVLSDAGEIVAFVPFAAASDGLAGPLGEGISDAQALITHPAWEAEPPRMVAAAGLRAWRFDHLVGAHPGFAPYCHRVDVAPRLDLSEGWDDYRERVAGVSRTVLSDTARRRRRLEREVGVVDFAWRTHDRDALEVLRRWKSEQYRRTGTWDRFAHGWISQVVDDLATVEGHHAGLAGWLSTLRADGRLVAAHFGLRAGEQLSYWFPAFDPEAPRYSPGVVLLLDMAEAATRDGVTCLDLGKRAHGYKNRVATARVPVAEGVVPAGAPC